MLFHRIRPYRSPLPICCLIGSAVLAGCASGPPAPVEDLTIADTNPPVAPAVPKTTGSVPGADTYRVAAGDTLYSIAFRRGLDYRDLARWNDIAPPYTIYAGELLHLRAPSGAVAQPAPGKAVTEAAPDRALAARTMPLTPLATSPPASRPATAPGAPEPKHLPPPGATARPAESASLVSTPASATPPATPAAKPASPPKPVAELTAGGVVWRWPADGKVIGTYVDGDQTRQGIDIAGHAGDPVRAAADGVVVYSGNGLIGYGELIIVKHNASYLSAYAHNRKRLVAEGEHVHAGQEIAELGATASPRDELHFEIRKNGKPVNPLDYLPAR